MNMKLITIDVSNNPIIQPPLEICERGIESMKGYYTSDYPSITTLRQILEEREQRREEEAEEKQNSIQMNTSYYPSITMRRQILNEEAEQQREEEEEQISVQMEENLSKSNYCRQMEAMYRQEALLSPKTTSNDWQILEKDNAKEAQKNQPSDTEPTRPANNTGIDDDEYEYWISRLKKDGWDLQYTPKELRNDKHIVLLAVQQSGDALKFASPTLQNDKEVVTAAIRQKYGGWALEFASPEMQAEKSVAMEAVKQCGGALKFVAPNLQNDKDVVMASVQNDGQALQYASTPLRNDKLIAIAAVQQDCLALQFSSPELRNDKDVVLIAVQQDGRTLRFASNNMQHDKDVVVVAVNNDPDSIRYAHEDIKRDVEVLIASGMFDVNHEDATQRRRRRCELKMENTQVSKISKKIALSTRFSLNQSSQSQATNFTKLLKEHIFFQTSGAFKFYAPNAFDKKTCDPDWTDFDHPCRGTKETCQFDDSLKTGHPTDECCWRYSFRCQLEEAKDTGGFLLQLIERGDGDDDDKPQMLGNGQRIELDMAQHLKMKIFHVYRPMDALGVEEIFDIFDIEEVVVAIKSWYEGGCQDMSECIIRPTSNDDSDSSDDGSD